MQVQVIPDGPSRHVLQCSGSLRWSARQELLHRFQQAVGQEPVKGVILDLRDVTLVDSAGLGAIFTLRKTLQTAGAQMVIARANPSIQRLLETVNMPKLIPLAEDLDQARSLLQS